MSASSRFVVCLVMLTCVAATTAAVQPQLLAVVGLQPRSAGEDNHGPSLQFELIEQRIKVKTLVIRRLLARETDLFEAAAVFRYLNEEPREKRDFRWRDLPGRSDEEKLCRQVILWFGAYLDGTTPRSQAQERVDELERELAQHIARNGTVKLPER